MCSSDVYGQKNAYQNLVGLEAIADFEIGLFADKIETMESLVSDNNGGTQIQSYGKINDPFDFIENDKARKNLEEGFDTFIYNMNEVWTATQKSDIFSLFSILFEKVASISAKIDEFYKPSMSSSLKSAHGQILMMVRGSNKYFKVLVWYFF